MHFAYIVSWNIRTLTEQAKFYFLFTHEHTQNVILCAQEYLHNKTLKNPKTAVSLSFVVFFTTAQFPPPPPSGMSLREINSRLLRNL
jgi:hypothetical protein